MNAILKRIAELRDSPTHDTICERLSEFASYKNRPSDDWFSELCFCLLTANSKASTALEIQRQLGPHGFLTMPQEQLTAFIKANKHRFHNTKGARIVEARKHKDVKGILAKWSADNLEDNFEAREWLVENVKGLGMKEASHFLRNVGYQHLAIVDRHIVRVLLANKLIAEQKTITKKIYLDIERKLADIAKAAKMTQAELDLVLWYIKTGRVWK